MNGVFITGTDTGVGKTIVSAALLCALKSAGVDAVYMKPVQTGCQRRGKKLIAPDLELVYSLAGIRPSEKERELMAPYRYRRACSPHLAAALEGQKIVISRVIKSFAALKRCHEFIIVEGAGGILTPLSQKSSMLDLMKALALPVIVVARPRLGTINHTLLTLRELRRAKLKITGVVINYALKASKTFIEKDNRAMIEKLGRAPVIAELPYLAQVRPELLAKVFLCRLLTHPPLSPGRSASAKPGRVPLQGGEHNLLSFNSFRQRRICLWHESSPPAEGWPRAGVGSGLTFANDST